ncbi:MAG TPA: hypothetical protein VEX86_06155 [Longimicrobium sp.]|nr:hypothetical protein [Longimicrobium sp.]
MRRIFPITSLLIPTLAACGGGGERVSIRGTFADTAAMPTAVFAVEAERQVEVKRGAFHLRDLSAGPVTLRLVRGVDTVATIALHNVPAGTALELNGLATDAATRRAFPRTLSLNGPPVLLVNNMRMGRADAVPAQVDARGVVLAASADGAALLVRPGDAAMPDLRVVLGLGTETLARDSTPVDPAAVRAGDSVRVEGRADQGFVIATRVTTWATSTTALREDEPASVAPERGERAAAAASTPVRAPAAVRVPVSVPREIRRQVDRLERGRGGGRGRGNGKGKGNKG